MRDNNELKQQVLCLPQQERAELAEALIRSLDDRSGMVNEEESRQAWMKEAQRRAEAHDRGETSSRDWEEFRDELRTKLQ